MDKPIMREFLIILLRRRARKTCLKISSSLKKTVINVLKQSQNWTETPCLIIHEKFGGYSKKHSFLFPITQVRMRYDIIHFLDQWKRKFWSHCQLFFWQNNQGRKLTLLILYYHWSSMYLMLCQFNMFSFFFLSWFIFSYIL